MRQPPRTRARTFLIDRIQSDEAAYAQLMATAEPHDPGVDDAGAPELYDEPWVTPPFQPILAIGAVILIACGFGLYEYVLVSFWSVPWMGIHERIPWPAFAIAATAIVLSIAGLRLALGLDSPHAKLGFGLLAFLSCIVVGAGGGRFVSYAMRVTLNPPFDAEARGGTAIPRLRARRSERLESAVDRRRPMRAATLIYVYRGDYCPFARFELAELTAHAGDFRRAGVDTVAISTDPVERSKMLAGFLRTKIPLLSDTGEIDPRTARSRATSSQWRARQRDTGVFYRRSRRSRAMDLYVDLLSRTAAAGNSPRRGKISHCRRVHDASSADSIAAVAMAGESAANIAPIDATPAGRAAGSVDANNSRVRSDVMPPSAKTGIAPAPHAALSPLAPHAGPAAGLESGSKTGRKPQSRRPRARRRRRQAASGWILR